MTVLVKAGRMGFLDCLVEGRHQGVKLTTKVLVDEYTSTGFRV